MLTSQKPKTVSHPTRAGPKRPERIDTKPRPNGKTTPRAYSATITRVPSQAISTAASFRMLMIIGLTTLFSAAQLCLSQALPPSEIIDRAGLRRGFGCLAPDRAMPGRLSEQARRATPECEREEQHTRNDQHIAAQEIVRGIEELNQGNQDHEASQHVPRSECQQEQQHER